MGSYAQCWLGGLYVGSSKNDVDHGIMQLFRPSDKRTLPARSVDLPSQLKDWTDDLEDDGANVVFYTAPAAVVQDRLELLGYTLDTAKSAFAKSLGVEAANHAEWSRGAHGELFKEEARLPDDQVEVPEAESQRGRRRRCRRSRPSVHADTCLARRPTDSNGIAAPVITCPSRQCLLRVVM
jgi:HEPN superfamily Toprim-like protein